ncbi:MAG: redoxin domain-containing protein [Flavobacteriales bacterium]
MRQIFSLFFIAIAFSQSAFSQLTTGSIAPDFTLTDTEGNTHTLYDYLNQGKTVYIDFWAAHCPSCWAYHNQGHIQNLYLQHGPVGSTSQDVVVFGIEVDSNNGLNEFNGISGITQGNWLEGISYPVINPEGTLLSDIYQQWHVDYYPLIYSICPDGIITLQGQETTSSLYTSVESCEATSINTNVENVEVKITYSNQNIYLTGIEGEMQLDIVDIAGRVLQTETVNSFKSTIVLNSFQRGIYFCRLTPIHGKVITQRIVKQ